jgi:hypothetical protein
MPLILFLAKKLNSGKHIEPKVLKPKIFDVIQEFLTY